jgi:signal transduction histidine kinase
MAALVLVVVGLGAEWAHAPSGMTVAGVVDLATGWVIGACGLVAWARASGSLVGPLLVATSFAWFLGTLRDPGTETGRLALSLLYLYAGVLLHAVFTWPMGRTTRSLDRVLVTGGYIVALALPLWQRDAGILIIGALLGIAVLAQYLSLSQSMRTVRRPAIVLGGVLVVALVGKGWVSQRFQKAGLAIPGDPDTLWSIVLVVVAAGLAWNLLLLQRRRAQVTDLVIRLGELDAAGTVAAMDGATANDPAVAAAVDRAAQMIARNHALHIELAAQVRELGASRRRLLEVGDEERSALEQRLRDGALLHLSELRSTVAALETGLPDPSLAGARLQRAAEQLRLASVELEEIAQGLDPVDMAEGGLVSALRDMAARSPLPVDLAVSGELEASASAQMTLYYVASEALANIIRHAQAAHAWLRISAAPGSVILDVEDDGVGGADPVRGGGLRGLQDRLDALGGSLLVSSRNGGGTWLQARLPSDGDGA